MSGPKCGSYSVVRNRAIEARRLLAARQEAADLAARTIEVRAAAAALASRGLGQVDLDQLPTSTGETPADLGASNRALAHALDAAERSIRAIEHDEIVRQSLDRLAGGIDGTAARVVGAPQQLAAQASTTFASIGGILDNLDAGVTDAERASLLALADTILQVAPASAGPLLIELRVRRRAVEVAARRRAADAERAQSLLDDLAGLAGDDVRWAQGLLHDVISQRRALEAADIAKVERIATASRAEADRAYTASVLEQTLVDLGYEVEEGFSTSVLEDRSVHAASERWPDHAVQLTLDDGELAVRVVRTEATGDPARDASVEAAFCKDFGEMTARMHQQGVDVRLTAHESPGAVAMTTAPANVKMRRRQRGGKPATRARTHER